MPALLCLSLLLMSRLNAKASADSLSSLDTSSSLCMIHSYSPRSSDACTVALKAWGEQEEVFIFQLSLCIAVAVSTKNLEQGDDVLPLNRVPGNFPMLSCQPPGNRWTLLLFWARGIFYTRKPKSLSAAVTLHWFRTPFYMQNSPWTHLPILSVHCCPCFFSHLCGIYGSSSGWCSTELTKQRPLLCTPAGCPIHFQTQSIKSCTHQLQVCCLHLYHTNPVSLWNN